MYIFLWGIPLYKTIFKMVESSANIFLLLRKRADVIIISVFPEIVTYPNRCRGAETKIVTREYKGSFQFNEQVS